MERLKRKTNTVKETTLTKNEVEVIDFKTNKKFSVKVVRRTSRVVLPYSKGKVEDKDPVICLVVSLSSEREKHSYE